MPPSQVVDLLERAKTDPDVAAYIVELANHRDKLKACR